MKTYAFNKANYTSQGTAQSTESDGKPQAQLRVMTFNSLNTDDGQQAPQHAQIVLMGEASTDVEPLAFFTAEQARKLASALLAAADTAASDAADC